MNMLYIVVTPFNALLGVFKDKKQAEIYATKIPGARVQYIYTDLNVRY